LGERGIFRNLLGDDFIQHLYGFRKGLVVVAEGDEEGFH